MFNGGVYQIFIFNFSGRSLFHDMDFHVCSLNEHFLQNDVKTNDSKQTKLINNHSNYTYRRIISVDLKKKL